MRQRHRRRHPAAAALETSAAAAGTAAKGAAGGAAAGRRAPAAPTVLAVAGALALLAALAAVPQPAACIHLDPPKVPHAMNFIPYPFEWKHRGPNGTLRHPRSVACTLIRNEAQFFEEWAAFHLMVGFDLIVVYDDSSTDELEAIAESFGDMVYLFRWPPPDLKLSDLEAHIQLGRQVAAFQHCYDHFKTTTNFVGIFDVDEFVYPCQRGTQPLSSNLLQAELHRGFMDATYPSVQLDCLRFGAPWGERWDNPPKPDELTLERHTFRAPYVLFEKRIHDLLYTALEDCNKTIDGYSLCNTQGSGSNKQIYHTELYRGDAVVGVHNGNLWRISGTYDRHSGICCNHYQQRSWKGMMAKAEKNRNPHLRAQAESWMVREFYASVRDDLVLQYLPELHCLLGALRGEPGCSLQPE